MIWAGECRIQYTGTYPTSAGGCSGKVPPGWSGRLQWRHRKMVVSGANDEPARRRRMQNRHGWTDGGPCRMPVGVQGQLRHHDSQGRRLSRWVRLSGVNIPRAVPRASAPSTRFVPRYAYGEAEGSATRSSVSCTPFANHRGGPRQQTAWRPQGGVEEFLPRLQHPPSPS